MKVWIYVDEDQRAGLESITTVLKDTIPNFHWDIITDQEKYVSELGVYKITAGSESFGCEDLHWEAPSVFLKNKKKKEAVWQDINEKVISAMRKEVVPKVRLSLNDEQLQHLMSMIMNSKSSFVLDHPNGQTIGVNTTSDVDIRLTSSDIASMLAASWLFKSGGIRLTN